MNSRQTKLLRMSALLLCIVLVLPTAGVWAASDVYINSSGETAHLQNGSTYAIGSGGTGLIDSDTVYALTANGLQTLDASAQAGENPGGGGLVYTDGKISVPTNTVLVGLRYYYSSSRDTGLSEANLENAVGSGYEIGYLDADRIFHAVGSTPETKITMRVTSGTGIGIYQTDTNTLLYQVASTGKDSYLAIHPVSQGGDAVTWFKGYRYYGDFAYAVLGAGKISVINVVEMEKYVMGVCANEMTESWPVEALKAQAVAARTYVGALLKSSVYYKSGGFDVTADTYSQAYSGCGQVGGNIQRAATETAGEYLTYNGAFCQALYFSSDGGSTEDNKNVNGYDIPYLKGVIDPYESAADSINSRSSWTVTKTPSQLASAMGLADVVSVTPVYSATGNVIRLTFTSSSGKTAEITGDSCRTKLGLNSIHYTVTKDGSGNYVFNGGGWGHNIGMSQYGAYAMAKHYGKTYRDILGFYYTGVGLSKGVS